MIRSLLFLVFFSASFASFGQTWKFYRNEFSFAIGASNFLGEVGGANQEGTNGVRDLEFSMTRPTLGIGYSYKLSQYSKFRTTFLYGTLKGDDQLTQERFRNHRNLHFRSPLFELSAVIEVYPFTERIGHLYRLHGTRGKKSSQLSPYFLLGIGGFYYNPKALDPTTNKWIALRPLSTEGQGLPGGAASYKRISICLPMGIGLKYAIDKEWSIGFEMSGRMTFTDYIDDVSTTYYDPNTIQDAKGPTAAYFSDPSSGPFVYANGYVAETTNPGMQRGDPNDNDSYLFAIFSIHYRFLKGRIHMPKF
jgi:hypothetical protein